MSGAQPAAIKPPQSKTIAPEDDGNAKGDLDGGGFQPVIPNGGNFRPASQPGHAIGLGTGLEAEVGNAKNETLAAEAGEGDGGKTDNAAGRRGRTGDNLGDSEQMSSKGASVRAPLPVAAFSSSLPLPSEQSNLLETLSDTLLTREQDKEAELWLKSLLPSLSHGWWDVAANGKGFVIKQRWRNKGQQTQTYPRVSREQFISLQEKEFEDAKNIIEDRVVGHIEECLASPKADKRTRSGCAAERLGIKH